MLALLAILAFSLIAVPDVRAAQRPNFVIVQTDDMALQMLNGTYLDRGRKPVPIMPRLTDRFVSGGFDFQSAYTPSPLCSPSRASLFSGRLPRNHGVVTNSGPFGGWQGWLESEAMNPNLATVLDAAGYHTAHFGKWINNYGEDPVKAPAVVPPGWDVWASDSTDQSTRDYYGYFQLLRNEREGILDEIRGPYGSRTYGNDLGIDPAWCDSFSKSQFCNYHADRMNLLTADEIREAEEPFLVMVDHHGPHGDQALPAGPQPATRHIGLADREVMPRPPSFDEKNTTDKDFLIQRSNGRLTQSRIATIEKIWKRTIENLQAVDEGIDLIHRALRETGRLDNTYFIFTSDNGFFHGQHRFSWGKGLAYEESARVPLVIAGPGIRAGDKRIEPVTPLDIAPTVLDLAGLEPGGMQFDGRSLRPFLEGGTAPDRAILVELLAPAEMAGDPDYPPQIPVTSVDPDLPPATAPFLRYRGIRIGSYKYFKFDSGGEELYDLAKDPYELYNQVRSPGYAPLLEFMRSKAAQYRDCAGEACLVPPGTPPAAGELITDARKPPTVIGLGRAFHFRQKIYATLACPAESRKACRITAEARNAGVRITGQVKRRVARGAKVRVALPIPPRRELEVLRLSELGQKSLVIRAKIKGKRRPVDRTVEFLQR